ncbi:MAG: TIGR02221 family CRISPR-associated protein [Candidatus Heimdallarchaeaceae archaeon]
MSRVLFSFLGTGNYLECNYVLNGNKIEKVRYIQEAIINLLCSDWEENDRIVLFITNESKAKNWLDTWKKEKETGEVIEIQGLKTRLELLNLKPKIEECLIPSGKNETELWEIFERIYENIQSEDEIIFDITHAFRSLPLIAMIILNYAKVLKNISLSGIYYGAFEALGPIREVEKLPVEERDAPIFDLTPFVQLLDWALITNSFLHFGDLSKAIELMSKEKLKIKGKGEGTKSGILREEKMIKDLNSFTNIFKTNRGVDIIEKHDFGALKKTIRRFSKRETSTKMLNLLLSKMYQKIRVFENESIENGYKAVEWCLEHNLIQQAYTLLQENMITEIVVKYYGIEEMRDYDKREKVKAAFQGLIKQEDDISNDKEDKELLEIQKLIGKDFATIFNELTDYRNDINHAGMRKNPKSARVLMQSIKDINKRLQKYRAEYQL